MADSFPEGSAPDAPNASDAPAGTGTELPPLRPPARRGQPESGETSSAEPGAHAQAGGDGTGNGSATLTGPAQARPEAPEAALPPLRSPTTTPPAEPPAQPPAQQPATPAPAAPADGEPPNRRGLWAVVWTVTAVVAVVAVVVVAVALGRSSNEPAPPPPTDQGGTGTGLQFAFPPGTAVYVVDRTSTGYVATGKHRRPFNVHVNEIRNETPDDVNGHLGFDVESSTWGDENGQTLQGSPFVVAPVVVQPSGEITSGGDVPYLFTLPGYEAGTPGTDMFLPVVPDRGLFPGEVWSTKYTRTYDTAGGGSIVYTAQNKFLGFSTKNGLRQARVLTVGTMAVDVEVGVRLFMKLAPGAFPNGQFSPGADPAVGFKGTIDYSITSLIDPATHVLNRSDASARVHLDILEPPRTLQGEQIHLGLDSFVHVLAIRALNPQPTPSAGAPTPGPALSGPTAPSGPSGASGPSS